MRSTLLKTVLASSALLISAAEIDRDTVLDIKPKIPVAIGKPECVYNAIHQSNIDCNINAILECFEEETNKEILDRIQQCLVSSGCISKEVVDESYVWVHTCRPVAEVEEEEYLGKELKKRKDDDSASSSTESTEDSTSKTTDSASKAATSEITTSEKTTSSSSETTSTSASAAASTTVVSSTTSSSSSTTSGSTLSTSTITSTSSASSTSTNSCFDYSTQHTSACWFTTGSKTCASATVTASSCADGMYCTTNSAGTDICMKMDNNLTTSGTAVAIVFGTAVATFIITMISCACKDSRARAKGRAAIDATLEAKAKLATAAIDMEATKRTGSSTFPSKRTPSDGTIPNRTRSPLSNVPQIPSQYFGDASEDTRTLLGGSRQGSPSPMSRSLTGGSNGEGPNYSPNGSGRSSPSNQYHDYEGMR